MMYVDAICKGIDDIPTVDMETRQLILKKYEEEGKMQMIIGIGCTGGQHRSVTLTNYFAEYYSQFYQVYKWHRDADH